MSGRIIVVGDPRQALYRFRGADAKAFERIEEMFSKDKRGIVTCELPINYRCSKKIINHSKLWVKELQGFKKEEGIVDEIYYNESLQRANNDNVDIGLKDGCLGESRVLENATFAFLCRINVSLVITAYRLMGLKKKVCIIGQSQFGTPLVNLIEKLCYPKNKVLHTNRISDRIDASGSIVEEGLLTRLRSDFRIQSEKLKSDGFERKLESLQQNVECIEVIALNAKDDKVTTVLEDIEELFTEEPEPGVITLSTIHKSKGLEWDVVFILRPDLMPHPKAKSCEELEQEKNAQYVAATRAKNRLYYVKNWPGENFSYSRPVSEYEKPETISKESDIKD